MEFNDLKLKTISGPARWLLSCILLVLTFGYLHGIGFVYLTTGIAPVGVEERYRGSEFTGQDLSTAKEIQYEKSLPEMFNIIHTHILSIGFIFIVISTIFYFSSLTEKWKQFWSIEPFFAIFISFTAMWLMRYVHPKFSWLLVCSGAMMALAFFVMVFYCLKDLWSRIE
jgi:hypothetical protein